MTKLVQYGKQLTAYSVIRSVKNDSVYVTNADQESNIRKYSLVPVRNFRSGCGVMPNTPDVVFESYKYIMRFGSGYIA